MNPLTDIIRRCHQQRENPLRQQKTVLTPTLYDRDYPYQFAVYCAHRYRVLLADLEQADISFMPIGNAPQHDRGPRDFGGERFSKRQGIKDWKMRQWHSSWGIQVYTGIPSECDGARWHDIDFKYEALCAAPGAVLACVEALVSAVANPLLTLSKDGGLRFSCRVPDYLHPNTEQERLYIYKHTPTTENPHQQDVYLKILGEEGYSPWDARYEILLGNLLDPPIIHKGILFAPIEALRSELHEPAPLGEQELKQTVITAPLSLGSHYLNLAKEAFLKRGFSYVRQKDCSHLWIPPGGDFDDCHILLWEDDDAVRLRASTSKAGLPMDATLITDVWDDTGILPPIPTAGLPVSDKVLAVREGSLSPLAIKRSRPVLQKSEYVERNYGTSDGKAAEIQRILDENVRILGLITQTSTGKNYDVESYVFNGGTICLNLPPVIAGIAEKRLQERNVSSVALWKSRMHRWKRVKEIPADVRMENPFQYGNVCEDAERCSALEQKGGNARESICPQCPVYTECQQRGYLSQPTVLQHAKAHISTGYQLFFSPHCTEAMEQILREPDETEQLCIVDETHAHELFLYCELSKKILEAWRVNWQGGVLGDFAEALLNVLEIKDKSRSDVVTRIRATMPTFQWQEKELIRQMCHLNVPGKVVARGTVDAETGKGLARFTIEFEGGGAAYIPLNDNAENRLTEMGLPFFRLHSFVPNEDIKVPMPMAQAIQLGILDTETVPNIQEFPTVCPDPNWTFWHQLNHFFDYYTSGTDAPMLWDSEVLHFWVPPMLHPSINRLLLISVTLSEQHLHKIFPNDKISVIHAEPMAWGAGNQVFQIRTGTYPLDTILDYDSNWDAIGLSEMGLSFFIRICAEIERDPSVKHAIITYRDVIRQLKHIAKKENVCFVTDLKDARRFEIGAEEADVIWIVGTPRWAPDFIWRRAQILFGNDEEPLCYEKETESDRYKDERVQSVYEGSVVGFLIQIVGHAKLHQFANKKIVLITSFPVPDITDRPETLLFDWEDFEVAGGFDKLPEVIATRERFEAERANLTADSNREEVERVLGCSSRQANRILKKFRGGKPLRVPFREQILSLLSDGEKKTAALVTAIEGHPKAVNNELTRLVEAGEIVKARRGVYTLPSP